MRGRFEQLQEESPPASSPAQKINTSPVRTRASSMINKDGSSNEEGKKAQGKLTYPTEASEQDQKHLGGVGSIPAQGTPNSGSFLSGITSPIRSCSKNTRAPTARKYSIDSIRERREHAEIQTPNTYSHGLLTKSAGEKLDICGAELKPSIVKRIPVFKSTDTGLNSEGKKFTKEAGEEAIADSHGKRGRLFGHIRSRSHGNFIIKRDSSIEKNSPTDSVKKQENVLNRDWLTQKWKQKGNVNLYNNQDSKSNSSFEGKQKIVANVVKNMKNKEKPKVLRKLSFSSKTEKELKNKKVKAVNSYSKDRQIGPSLPPADKANRADNFKANTRFMKADDHKLVKDKVSPDMQKTSHISGAAVATVAIAKAVADVALKKSGTVTSNSDEIFSSPCSEDTLAIPPERPPRRRSSGAGLPPRKKGKAPSPPDHFSVSPIALNKTEYQTPGVKKCTSDEELYSLSITGIENHVEHKMSPDVMAGRHNESPDLCKSSESLLSFQSLEKSRDNSPVMINQVSSPLLTKRLQRGQNALCRTQNEQRDKVCEEKSKIFKSELQSIHLESNKETSMLTKEEQNCERNCTEVSESSLCLDDEGNNDTTLDSTVKSDMECLPVGPPPRKPPRTFAYDIYRHVKVSKSDEEHGEKETGDSNENSQSETSNVTPIYAVPVKKKNTKKIIAKPPVRSKSDLTSKDMSKPSIAPKPAHILTKAKRASVVDPLSSIEKDEEAAITSEFQRQAHIRYSLRRPKKPPPVPPHYPEMEDNTISDSGTSSNIANTSIKSHTDISCFKNNQRNQHENIHSSKNALDSNSNTQEFSENEHSSSESLNLRRRLQSKCFSPDLSNYEDLRLPLPTVTVTSHSTHNLRTSSPSLENDQPLSLGYCSVDSPSPDLTDLYKKRSMSDETLYKVRMYISVIAYTTL